MRRHLFVVLLLALTALIASCGDDNEDPVLDPPTLSTPSTEAPAVDPTADDTSTDVDGTDPSADDTTNRTDDDPTASTSTTEPEDVVTTTSERLDPDDPNYPTLPPSPTVTYPDTGDS